MNLTAATRPQLMLGVMPSRAVSEPQDLQLLKRQSSIGAGLARNVVGEPEAIPANLRVSHFW